MERFLRVNKFVRYIGAILLILMLIFTSTAAASPTIQQSKVSQSTVASALAVQANSAVSDEEKIKAMIDAYFTTRYDGQKMLETQDFSSLIEDNTLEWVKKEKDKRNIELYIAQLFDLRYVSYQYTLDYDSISISNNNAIVQLRENHQVIFEALAPATSEMTNLYHTFFLHNKDGIWFISQDKYQDELSQQLLHSTKDEILSQVDVNYREYLNQKRLSSSADKSVLTKSSLLSPALTSYSYNRSAAAIYADNHVPHDSCGGDCAYNTTYYKTEGSDDCTNYVSQALYAGEGKTPPDTSGMPGTGRSYTYDWYYVFNNPPGTQNGSGSLPWVRVQAQYDFITGNSSRIGPYGTSGSFGNTQIGDIVQLYNAGGDQIWDHEGIIIATGLTYSTEIVDAHTTDRWHYPLSYWASYQMRFILISGWRGS